MTKNARQSGKVYRFALYGRTASGKTCILTALAMNRVAHPENFTCDWIEQPTESLRSFNADPMFIQGREWLRQAKECLEVGDVPPPNPNQLEPFRFLFDFTAPERGAMQVELIDYSGELIDPSIGNDELAQRLRHHLTQMDGILVLAEAPHPGSDSAPLFEEIRRLKQAFQSLRGELQEGPRFPVPVVLMINKWDRRSEVEDHNPYELDHELIAFLQSEPEPPHRALIDTLQNAVTDSNFKCLPVSAFGDHEVASRAGPDGIPRMVERPKQVNPLPTYNLEDGFIWAVDRRNIIDLTQFRSRYSRIASWKFWQLFSGKTSPRALRRVGKELHLRFATGSPQAESVRRAVRRCSLIALTQLLVLFMLLSVGTLGTEAVIDSQHIRKAQTALANPSASREELRDATHWLKSYATSPAYRHLIAHQVFPRQRAAQLLEESLKERSKLAWKTLMDTEPEARYSLAVEYLEDFPNTEHAEDARRIVASVDRARKNRENQEAIQEFRTDFNALFALSNPPLEKARKLQERLHHMPPHPDAQDDGQYEALNLLRQQLTEKLVSLVKNQNEEMQRQNGHRLDTWEKLLEKTSREDLLEKLVRELRDVGLPFPDAANPEQMKKLAMLRQQAELKEAEEQQRQGWILFKKRYQALMDDHQPGLAARLLMERKPETTQLRGLKDDFRTQAPLAINGGVNRYVKSQSWAESVTWLERLKNDNALSTLWPQSINQIEKHLAEMRRRYDQDLYLQVKRYRDLEHVQQYLQLSPLQTMKKDVEQWKHYLTTSDKKQRLTLIWANCEWGKIKKRKSYNIRIELNGKTILEKNKVSLAPETTSGELGRATFEAKPSDIINMKIEVTLPRKTFFDKDENFGRGRYARTVLGLKGKRVELVGKSGITSYATFHLEGLAQAPPLPDWKE